MKYLGFILAIFFISCGKLPSQNQPNSVASKNDEKLLKKIPQNFEIDTIETVEISNQNYSIITAINPKGDQIYEYWFANHKLYHKTNYLRTDYTYKWILNLDEDSEPEVIRAYGDSDGIDYAIYDIQDGTEVPVLYFSPALIDEQYPDQTFWGYPWDIKELIIKDKQIWASTHNENDRDDNFTLAETQKDMPYIYFQGSTTQPEMVIENVNAPKYYSLHSLLKEVSTSN